MNERRHSERLWTYVLGAFLAWMLVLLVLPKSFDSGEPSASAAKSVADHLDAGAFASHPGEYPSVELSSDWTIGPMQKEEKSNETIVLKGNLTVQAGGSLHLDNVTLVMNCTMDGEFWILIETDGELHMKMSVVTAFDKTTPVVHEQNPVQTYTVYGLRYHFVLRGSASIVQSTIEFLWGDDLWLHYGYPGGLEIYSDDVVIDLSRIGDAESFAIRIAGSSPTISRSVINRFMACGVSIEASNARFSRNYVDIDPIANPFEYCGLGASSGSPEIVDNVIEGDVRLGNAAIHSVALVANNTIVGGIYMIDDGSVLNNSITVGPGTGFEGLTGIAFTGNPRIEDNVITYMGPLDNPGPMGIVSTSSNIGGVIARNTINGFYVGVWAQMLSDALYEDNRIVGANQSILCQSRSAAKFIGNILEAAEYGFIAKGCWSTAIENNTFINTRKMDIYTESYAGTTSHLVATNNSFDPEKVLIADSDSSLLVNNYMHARVLDRNLRPLPGAMVGVDTFGLPPQQRLTGWEGEAMWFRVPYVNYTWDNYDKRLQLGNPFKRVFFSTSAFASYLAKNFNNLPNYPSPRSVNMSSSHWEYFIEVGAPDMVELSMERAQAVPNPSFLGTPVSVSAVVRNWGLVNATNVDIEFRNGGLTGTPIGFVLLGGIARLGGSRTVTVSWTPLATGDHALCAVVDPLNAIPEPDENNNGACTNLTVVALPDLIILPSDISFLPPPPFVDGSTVQITATIRNAGIADSPATVARFHDGIPPSPPIDGDVPVGPVSAGGSDIAQAQWIASGIGSHEVCTVADPDNIIAEIDETNNMACVPVQVLSLPDLAPISMETVPSSPITEGTISHVNVTVVNAGDLPAGGFDLLLFDDSNGNLAPDPGEDLGVRAMAGIAGHSQAYEEFQWTAYPAGAHSICAYADMPPGTVAESNETNNVMCMDVLVQPGPILRPDYVPVSPLPLPPVKAGLSSPVSLSIEVLNQGNGTATNDTTVAFFEQPSPPFSTSVLSPLAPAATSSRFTATWRSPATPGTYLVSVDVDYDGNVTEWDETNNVYTWTIEVVSGPVTSLAIGSPNHTAAFTFVKSATPLAFSTLDQSGLGIRNTTYMIDSGIPVNYTATGTFFLSGEGVHTIEWRSLDWAGNLEDVSSIDLAVDDNPPATAISIGEPKYTTGGTYVNSSTPLDLSATDVGVGSNSTFYRLWGGSWTGWLDYSSSFTLAGRDGTWFVEFLSFDYLGNAETVRNETLILDATPPVTTVSPASPFTLDATDSGCGVNVTMYRIDGGSWTVFTGGFTLAEGEHTIYYYSIDKLGNVEQERSLVVKPPVEVAVNYKPVVALIFAVILLVAGIWSSRRRPWKGGKDRMAVMKAFVLTALPFILVEAATGVLSLSFEPLRIPPLIGWGTGVDCTILAVGLLVSIIRSLWKRETKAENTRD